MHLRINIKEKRVEDIAVEGRLEWVSPPVARSIAQWQPMREGHRLLTNFKIYNNNNIFFDYLAFRNVFKIKI